MSRLWGIDDSGSLLPAYSAPSNAGAICSGLNRRTESERERQRETERQRERRESMELEAALTESRLMMASAEAGQQLEEQRDREGAERESTERRRGETAVDVEAAPMESSAIVLLD